MTLKQIALTPELSRMARQELGGMSQVAVSKASGVQAYVIKQWETGKFRPPAAALEKLRQYYEAEGVDMAQLAKDAAAVAEQRTGGAREPGALPAGFTHNARPGFFVSDALSDAVVDQLMERMGSNDDLIVDMLAKSFKTGLFGGQTEETEGDIRGLFAAMAESYLCFRFLQGRSVLQPNLDEGEPSTLGAFLAQWVRDGSGVANVLMPAAPAGKRTPSDIDSNEVEA